MKKTFLIFKAELIRSFLLIKTYPMEIFSNILVIFISFVAIYFGIGITSGTNNMNIDKLFLSYCFGILSMLIISDMGSNIAAESITGTLERIYTMPSRLFPVILIRCIISLILNILYIGIFFVISIFILKIKINFNFNLIFIFIGILPGLLGIGYILSGLTLRYKRLGDIYSLLQFFYLFLALIPYEKFPLFLKYLTGIVPGVMAIQILRDYQTINLYSLNFYLMIIYGILHLVTGLYLFKLFEKLTLKKGYLGRY